MSTIMSEIISSLESIIEIMLTHRMDSAPIICIIANKTIEIPQHDHLRPSTFQCIVQVSMTNFKIHFHDENFSGKRRTINYRT